MCQLSCPPTQQGLALRQLAYPPLRPHLSGPGAEEVSSTILTRASAFDPSLPVRLSGRLDSRWITIGRWSGCASAQGYLRTDYYGGGGEPERWSE